MRDPLLGVLIDEATRKAGGALTLCEHGGKTGYWVNYEGSRMFYPVDLSTPYEESERVTDDGGDEIVEMWAQTTSKLLRFVPIYVDAHTWRILNWDDVSSMLQIVEPDTQAIDVAGLWPKPRTTDKAVLVTPIPNGSAQQAMIEPKVGGMFFAHDPGGKGQARDLIAEAKRKQMPSPDTQMALQQEMQRRDGLLSNELAAYQNQLGGLLGFVPDATDAMIDWKRMQPGDTRQASMQTQTTARRILSGEPIDRKERNPSSAPSIVARAAVDHLFQHPARPQDPGDPLDDPMVLRRVSVVTNQFQARVRGLGRMPRQESISTGMRMAFYDPPQDLPKLAEKLHEFDTLKNRVFNAHGFDAQHHGMVLHMLDGAASALTQISALFGSRIRVHPTMIQQTGLDTVCLGLAHDMVDKEQAADQITAWVTENLLPTVEECLAAADENEELHQLLTGSNPTYDLATVVRVHNIQNQMAKKALVVASAFGGLEAATGVIGHLRGEIKKPTNIRVPKEKHGAVAGWALQSGITPVSTLTSHDGAPTGIQVPGEAAEQLPSSIDAQAYRQELAGRLKSGSDNTDDFSIDGFRADTKLSGQQQAVVRFVVEHKTACGAVGLQLPGQATIAALIGAFLGRGARSGWLIAPAGVCAELSPKLGHYLGVDVHVAGSMDPTVVGDDDRMRRYLDANRSTVLIVPDALARVDSDTLRYACSNTVYRPGFIVAYQVEGLLPTMEGLDAEWKFFALRSPAKRASSELWRVLNWLRPNTYGPLEQWSSTFGYSGHGNHISSKVLGDSFQSMLADVYVDGPSRANNDTTIARQIEQTPDELEALSRIGAGLYRNRIDGSSGGARASKHSQIFGSTNGSVASQLMNDVRSHLEAGETGVILCRTAEAAQRAAACFAPGEIVAVTMDSPLEDRLNYGKALSDGVLVPGIRVSAVSGGYRHEGVLTAIAENMGSVTFDDGANVNLPLSNITSKLGGVAATPVALRTIRFTPTWTVHYDYPHELDWKSGTHYRYSPTAYELPVVQNEYDEHDLLHDDVTEPLSAALSEPEFTIVVLADHARKDRLAAKHQSLYSHADVLGHPGPKLEDGVFGPGHYFHHNKEHAVNTVDSDHVVMRHTITPQHRLLHVDVGEDLLEHPELALLPASVKKQIRESEHALQKHVKKLGYQGITTTQNGTPRSTMLFDDKLIEGSRIVDPKEYGFQIQPGDDTVSQMGHLVHDPVTRVRKYVNRKMNRSTAGERENPMMKIENAATGISHHIGKKGPQEWWEDVKTTLTPEQIEMGKQWYARLRPLFEEHFGVDDAPKWMMAWLASQQNASVTAGMQNVFRSQAWLKNILYRKKTKDGQILDSHLKAGIPHDRLIAIMQNDMDNVSEMGAKLHDFVDSAYGKKYRTIVGNDRRMGAPVAYDVHSNRDHGRVDPTTMGQFHKWSKQGVLKVNGMSAKFVPTAWAKKSDTRLEDGKKSEQVPSEGYFLLNNGKKLPVKPDMAGAPSEQDYENGVEWFNQVFQHMQETGQGGQWDHAHQIQAVGWMRALKGLMGRDLEVPDVMFRNNIRHLSAEVAFGEGTPRESRFGSDWNTLSSKQRSDITRKVIDHLMPKIAEYTGARHLHTHHSMGAWYDAANPSTNIKMLGNSDVIQLSHAMIGHALQQDGVFQYGLSSGGDTPGVAFTTKGTHFDDPVFAQKFWRKVRAKLHDSKKDASLVSGFTPITTADGDRGIIMIQDRGEEEYEKKDGTKAKRRPPAWKEHHHTQIADAVEAVARDLGISGEITHGIQAKTDYRGHNWKDGDHSGSGYYPDDLDPATREAARGFVSDQLWPELDEILEKEIAHAKANPERDPEEPEYNRVVDPKITRRTWTNDVNLAEFVPTGVPHVQQSARTYHSMVKDHYGLPDWSPGFYHPIDEDWAYSMADHADTLRHKPNSPKVKKAYEQLAQEVRHQYEHALLGGMKFSKWEQPGQPYNSSTEMIHDVAHNKHLWYFPSEGGFGNEGGDSSSHPLLQIDPDHGIPYNDMFRAVHDFYGHAQYGYAFGPRGEENAWIEHSKMFSPLAQRALTAETKLQNNWVNYGAHLRHPETGKVPKRGEQGYVHPMDRPYMEQKAALPSEELSDWTRYEKKLLGGEYENVRVEK